MWLKKIRSYLSIFHLGRGLGLWPNFVEGFYYIQLYNVKKIQLLSEPKLIRYLYDIVPTTQAVHPLTLCRIFFLLVSFSLAWDKKKRHDKIEGKYLSWALYFHIRVGGKVLGQCKVWKQFLLHNMQNNCTKHTRHTDLLYFPAPLLNKQIYSLNSFLK